MVGVKIALIVELGATILSTSFAIYCLLFQAPAPLSRTFRAIMAFQMIVLLVLVASVAILSTPVVYLPYPIISFDGLFKLLNVPPSVLVGFALTLGLLAAAIVFPLYYYRLCILLPKEHFLNNKWCSSLTYGLIYTVSGLVPMPMFILANSVRDSYLLKKELLDQLQIYYDDFYSNEKYVIDLSLENMWVSGGLCLMLVEWFLAGGLIIFSTSYVYCVMYKGGHLSNRSKRHHQLIFAPLLLMGSILLIECLILIPFGLYLIVSRSLRADIFNLVLVIGMGLLPTAQIAFVSSYNPCQKYIQKIFKKRMATVTMGQEDPKQFVVL